jgi:sugar phosphate isomerase/epimerase
VIVRRHPDVHLCYCTNIHAGESWAEVLASLSTHLLEVKRRTAPAQRFGVGLRLSNRAAVELGEPEALAGFLEFLRRHDLYVFTINGFPYGRFHGEPVKERVYLPDWLDDERVDYSNRLATILAAVLPDGVYGTISTVPGCHRSRGTMEQVGPAIASRLFRHVAMLVRIREACGATIGLALEPEPRCVLETSEEAIAFFERHVFDEAGVRAFAALAGLTTGAAAEALRRHLGVCLDACHAAVEFEDPEVAARSFAEAGIRVLKVQVSAGLRVRAPDTAALDALCAFAEGVYLHQPVIRDAAGLRRYGDLPEAIADARRGKVGDEWRVHFHVPLFRERLGRFESTQDFLRALLARQARDPISSQLEVETYTWDVLPEEYRREPVAEAIARELRWVRDALGTTP